MQEKNPTPDSDLELLEKRNPGRPFKPVDEEGVYKLAKKLWTISEIASFFNVSDRTITSRFSKIIATARLDGQATIRDLQWKRAMEGSDKMILHLSEHNLGQHKKITQEIKSDVTVQSGDKVRELNLKVLDLVEDKVKWETERQLLPKT